MSVLKNRHEDLYLLLRKNMLCSDLHMIPVYSPTGQAEDATELSPFDLPTGHYQFCWRFYVFTEEDKETEVWADTAEHALICGAQVALKYAYEHPDNDGSEVVIRLMRPFNSIIYPS